MRRSFFYVTTALVALGVTGRAAAQSTLHAGDAGTRYKMVYQLSEGIGQAVRVIGNLRNHLNGTPGTKITVAALGHGTDFLVGGVKDAQGRLSGVPMVALVSIGVEFRVCHNSLMAFKVPEDRLLLGVKVVLAGVVEIARLQQEESFTYIKP